MRTLDFEKSLEGIEQRIAEMHKLAKDDGIDISSDLQRLQAKLMQQMEKIYEKLTPWQRVQLARHEDRPHTTDYIEGLIDNFQILCGDRCYGEDAAIVTGIGRFRKRTVVVIGQERGSSTETRIKHHFGLAHPEGYRKAKRMMRLAEHYQLPILTFVDTPGADPGIESEQRGQAEAIASCLATCLETSVPIITTIIGEGGSGGAVAIAAGDRVLMLENSIYTVISPEGCSSILWRDSAHGKTAAEQLRLTAKDLFQLGVIDKIISEPVGGAHRHAFAVVKGLGKEIDALLKQLVTLSPTDLIAARRKKFLAMGKVQL